MSNESNYLAAFANVRFRDEADLADNKAAVPLTTHFLHWHFTSPYYASLAMLGPIVDVDAMLRDFLFDDETKQLFHLYLAWMHKRKNRMARARKRLNLAIASTPEPSAFILACDALLMVGEDRIRLAQARFEESSKLASGGDSTDDDYVAKFCALWLAIYNEEAGWDEIRGKAELQNAAWTNASRLLQGYLPRSPLDRLEEICGHRVLKTDRSTHQRLAPTKIDTAVDFEF